MSNTHHAFAHAATVLPDWMAAQRFDAGNRQLGPKKMPVGRPCQLTIEQAMGSGFNGGTLADGKTPVVDPAIDRLTTDADSPGFTEEVGEAGLSAELEKSKLKRGAGCFHADSVQKEYSNSKQKAASLMIKLGMEVWKHIDEELHRRRKNSAWLADQLNSSRQVISGWKTRGVPAKRYEQIAALFGWTVDRLIAGVDDAPLPAAVPAPVAPAAESASAVYSPMALDVARMIDNIPDAQKKRRAYALILQIVAEDAAPSPTVPEQPQAGLVASPTPAPTRGQ